MVCCAAKHHGERLTPRPSGKVNLLPKYLIMISTHAAWHNYNTADGMCLHGHAALQRSDLSPRSASRGRARLVHHPVPGCCQASSGCVPLQARTDGRAVLPRLHIRRILIPDTVKTHLSEPMKGSYDSMSLVPLTQIPEPIISIFTPWLSSCSTRRSEHAYAHKPSNT